MAGLFQIDAEVLAALGVTGEELLNMGLREFSNLVYDKGYRINVDPTKEAEDGKGGLSIVMAQPEATKEDEHGKDNG